MAETLRDAYILRLVTLLEAERERAEALRDALVEIRDEEVVATWIYAIVINALAADDQRRTAPAGEE